MKIETHHLPQRWPHFRHTVYLPQILEQFQIHHNRMIEIEMEDLVVFHVLQRQCVNREIFLILEWFFLPFQLMQESNLLKQKS